MARVSVVGIFCLLSVAGGAEGATVPLLKYQTTGGKEGRQLIFSNNPEEIRAEAAYCDLADAKAFGTTECTKSLLRLENMRGKFRDWWEHSNKTRASLVYAVQVRNPGPGTAEVVVRGSGLVFNGIRDGGKEFGDMFRNYGAMKHSLAAGESMFVFRSPVVAPNLYFAGVVDFDVSGAPVVVENVAFAEAPAPELRYTGYDRRVIGPVHESLVYKGLSPHSEAVAEDVNFILTDEDLPGRLKVKYPQYRMPAQTTPPSSEGTCLEGTRPLCSGSVGAFETEPTETDAWVTHIAPDPVDDNPKRQRAVVSDMVKLFMPGFPEGCHPSAVDAADACVEISPFYKWFHPDFEDWKYPNWGNWAVHYKIKGTMENKGTLARTLHLGLRADGSSPIAYRGQDRVWRNFSLTKSDPHNPNDYFPYSEFVVNPGQTVNYSGEVILSGPATGTLEQLIKLVK